MPITLNRIPHLVFKPHPVMPEHGVRAEYKNWSIILTRGSYGSREGLYEVMGPGFGDDSDVEGHLTLGEVIIRIATYEENNAA